RQNVSLLCPARLKRCAQCLDPVGELKQNHAWIIGHSHEHFADRFRQLSAYGFAFLATSMVRNRKATAEKLFFVGDERSPALAQNGVFNSSANIPCDKIESLVGITPLHNRFSIEGEQLELLKGSPGQTHGIQLNEKHIDLSCLVSLHDSPH